MKDDTDQRTTDFEDEPVGADRSWDPTSFLTGALVGAAVGAGLALLFAPGAGHETRRLLRRRARALTRDAAEGLVSAGDETREALREKKEALRKKLAHGIERAGKELGV
jgi:gas vesicle protein